MKKKSSAPESATDGFYREWDARILDKEFKIRAYGFCHWSEVVFLSVDGKEFYKLVRNMKNWFEKKNKKTQRKEFFEGKIARRYLGEKNCFVEFCQNFLGCQTMSDLKRFKKVGKELNLKPRILELYIKFFKEFFQSRA